MEKFGSALVPDFAEFYGESLVDLIHTRHPVEVLLLIQGLPQTSRYVGRLMGEEHARGWSTQEWLSLDMRNIMEGLRAAVAGFLSGKKSAGKFREWSVYPGKEQERRRQQDKAMAKLRNMAWPGEK